jgi:asparagine synthase (glutamine-hydrolysing)
VHLYEEEGARFADKLNGRFSGIVVDLREGRIVLFNDRHGLNRVHFFENKGVFYFSSEAKALQRVLPELRRIDPRGLGEMFACGCVLQNRTLFPGISLVPGGSVWAFRPGERPRKSSYFRPEAWEGQERLDGREYYVKLKETWARVLPRYLRGKEQLAVSLTGGKDSRMIMAWARSSPGALPCYTFGGLYRECQDVKLARVVARTCAQAHQVISIGKAFLSEFPSLAERAVYLTDGAMDVSGAPELYANRFARQIAPVRLTGNYGQEILQSYVAFRPRPMNERILQKDFCQVLEVAARTYRDEIGSHPLSFVAFKQVPWFHYSRLSLELSQLTLRSPFLDKDLVALAYQAPAEPESNVKIQLRLIAEGNPALAGLPTDRGVRHKSVPLITAVNRLFQQFTIKAEYAYDYGMPQWLARFDHVLRPLRPERIFLGRHKFIHLRVWYRDELSGYIKDVLLDPRTLSRSYLDRRYLEKIVLAHVKGIGNYSLEINQILTSELIHRQFNDQ